MTSAGQRTGGATRLLCALQTAVALPAGVLLAGRLPDGYAFGAVLAVAVAGGARLGAGLPFGSRTRAALTLGLGAGGGAGLAFGTSLPPVAVAALLCVIGGAAGAAPRASTASTVLVWSAGPPLGVVVSLLAGPGVPFAALAALDAAALALLRRGRQRPGRRARRRRPPTRRGLDRPAAREQWPAGQRRWVNQRTP